LLCFHNPLGHDDCQSIWKQHPAIQAPLLVAAAAPLVVACVAGGCAALGAAATAAYYSTSNAVLLGAAGAGPLGGVAAKLGLASKACSQEASSAEAMALQRAASAGGPTTSVATKLTQAPNGSKGLSVATGDDAAALANAARSDGQVYTANIPTAVVNELKVQKLAYEKQVVMNGQQGTEIRFMPGAWEHIQGYFH
jgi:hypothetical protein